MNLESLRAYARKISPVPSVRGCRLGARSRAGIEFMMKTNADGSVVPAIKYLDHCNNRYGCPTCAYRESRDRADEIRAVIDDWTSHGKQCLLMSLNMGHSIDDDLDTNWDALEEAWVRFNKSERGIKMLRNRQALHGWCKVVEVDWTLAGWHPHFHVILFAEDAQAILDLRDKLLNTWAEEATKATGKVCLPEMQDLRMIDGSSARLASYLTKQGRSKAALSKVREEVARYGAARMNKRAPFELLVGAMYGDQDCLDLWREFDDATRLKGGKSRRSIAWSREYGPARRAEIVESATESRSGNAKLRPEIIGGMTRETFHAFRDDPEVLADLLFQVGIADPGNRVQALIDAARAHGVNGVYPASKWINFRFQADRIGSPREYAGDKPKRAEFYVERVDELKRKRLRGQGKPKGI